jgi:hypothetical protein
MQYLKEFLAEALRGLRYIKVNGPEHEGYGICYNLNCYMGQQTGKFTERYAKSWAHYSGEEGYPVPAYDFENPVDEYAYSEHLWNKDHPYGQMRWELLDHVITCIEKELADA